MTFFSVIIPSYNRCELFSRALNSVLVQSFADYEIIAVDDGSTDGTFEKLGSLPNFVRVLRQTNRGPGSARNLGARHAQGRYLAFLDSDDLWFPWTLEVYSNVIIKYRNPSFIAGKPYLFSDENEFDHVESCPAQSEEFLDYFASGDQWRWWGASSFVIRRDVFVSVGGFAEEHVNGEDADLALRLGVAPSFVQINAPVTFAYRQHAASATGDAKRTVAGAWFTVRVEKAGRYPGGKRRAMERRRILTRHTRPLTLDCLRQGFRPDAWGLYLSTFAWNASLGRVKYLAVFPVVAGAERFRRGKVAG